MNCGYVILGKHGASNSYCGKPLNGPKTYAPNSCWICPDHGCRTKGGQFGQPNHKCHSNKSR